MRTALSFLALCGAAFLLGAAPPPKGSGAPSGESEALRRKIGGPPASGIDLFERVRTSPLIARGHVVSAVPGSQTASTVHIDKWLKGTGPSDIVIDFAGGRPSTPKDQTEVFLMKPAPNVDAGPVRADMYAVTGPGERYLAPDAKSATLDKALLDEIAHAPDEAVLRQLVMLDPHIAAPAASRLALLAAASPPAFEAARGAIESADTDPQARTILLSMLGSRVPVATLAALAAPKNPELLRIDALQALGRKAANEPASRKDALAALQAQANDSVPAVRLNAGLALANAGQASALAPLQAVLAGTDQPLRAEAVRGVAELARTGNADAYGALEKLREDANSEVRTRANNLINQVGPKPATPRSQALLFWIIGAGVVIALLATFAVRRRKTA